MPDSSGADAGSVTVDPALPDMLNQIDRRTQDLARSANSFARAMTTAFSQSVTGGRSFDDVLKSLVLRMSDLSVRLAFKPIETGLASGFQNLFGGLFGGSGSGSGGGPSLVAAMGAVKPFAAGGVIGAPTYFPLMSGGLGLAGEAGPEAIMPLTRGPDGRLGVAAGASAPPNITVNIATPDADSFRRSEAYLTSQIARAVARGQRSL
jgi:lambda family phage tail tape measure protein